MVARLPNARTPAERVEYMIIVTEKLTEILDKETSALNERRPHQITEFAREKEKLTSAYENEIGVIRQDRELILKAPEAALDELKSATHKMHQAMERHARRLDRIKGVTEGIVKAITDEVKKTAGQGLGYGANAAMREAPKNFAASIALNQVV